MIVFSLIAAAMVAAAAALLAWPLFRPAKAAPDAEVAPSRRTAVVVAVLVPLTALGIYGSLSEWPWDAEKRAAAAEPSPILMVRQLERRLQREQGDAAGWSLLGRSWLVLGQAGNAVDAYGKAYTLTGGKDLESLVGLAESLTMADENEIDGRAGALFEQAFLIAPNDPKTLWYSGLSAYRRADLPVARARWSALIAQEPPAEVRQVLAAKVAEIDAALAQGGTPVSEPAPAAGTRVAIAVEIAPSLASQAPASATLFVFARTAEQGPPLAVVRRAVTQWPVDVTLTDQDVMLPGASLAGAASFNLVARVSRSGQPQAASGDLEGRIRYDGNVGGPVRLVIDRVLP